MEKVIELLEQNLNYLTNFGPSTKVKHNFQEIVNTLQECFMLKPKYDNSKYECQYCHKWISHKGRSSHNKSKRHLIEEAKAFGEWDFSVNDFK